MDPNGKRALFEAPVQAPPEALSARRWRDGRDALFSGPRRTPGTVIVECDTCTVRTRISLAELGLRILTGSLWVPILKSSHPHFLRCPSCGRRSWCRIRWLE